MSKTILIVDDDLDGRHMLKVFLERKGFDVNEASDGYEAVEKALEKRPDLIIMDMAMPLMDGVNSIRTMKLHDSLQDVPILALTAFGGFYDPRAREAGCDNVLHKPVDFEVLQPMVEKYIH